VALQSCSEAIDGTIPQTNPVCATLPQNGSKAGGNPLKRQQYGDLSDKYISGIEVDGDDIFTLSQRVTPLLR